MHYYSLLTRFYEIRFKFNAGFFYVIVILKHLYFIKKP